MTWRSVLLVLRQLKTNFGQHRQKWTLTKKKRQWEESVRWMDMLKRRKAKRKNTQKYRIENRDGVYCRLVLPHWSIVSLSQARACVYLLTHWFGFESAAAAAAAVVDAAAAAACCRIKCFFVFLVGFSFRLVSRFLCFVLHLCTRFDGAPCVCTERPCSCRVMVFTSVVYICACICMDDVQRTWAIVRAGECGCVCARVPLCVQQRVRSHEEDISTY